KFRQRFLNGGEPFGRRFLDSGLSHGQKRQTARVNGPSCNLLGEKRLNRRRFGQPNELMKQVVTLLGTRLGLGQALAQEARAPRRPSASAAARRLCSDGVFRTRKSSGTASLSRQTLTECRAACRTVSSGSVSAPRTAWRAVAELILVKVHTA